MCTHEQKCACVHTNTHSHTHPRIHYKYSNNHSIVFTLITPRTSHMGKTNEYALTPFFKYVGFNVN